MKTSVPLFEHLDYRTFLKAIYLERKAKGRYTYELFAQSLGLKERTFLQHVLAGKRELQHRHIDGIANSLGMNRDEQEYFEIMVNFSLSPNAHSKQELWEILKHKSRSSLNQVPMESQRLDLTQDWYAFPIKELLCLGITEELQIRKALCQSVSLEEIRNCVNKLIQLGFVQQNEQGAFIDLEPEISAPTETENAHVIQKFQSEMLHFAARNLHTFPKHARENQTISMPLSQSSFEKTRQAIRQCRDQLIQIYMEDTQPKNGVYQLQLNMFPLALLNKQKDAQ